MPSLYPPENLLSFVTHWQCEIGALTFFSFSLPLSLHAPLSPSLLVFCPLPIGSLISFEAAVAAAVDI